MDPSSPAKRRALAPLDANVNAMSPARKLHNKTTTLGSPLKSPIKSPLGLKRPLGAVIFDENSVVANKKQCQEPVAAPARSTTPAAPAAVSIPKPVHVPAAPAAAAPTPAPAPAQTEGEPDAKERLSEEPQQQQQDEEQQPEMESHEPQASRNRSASPDTSSVFDNSGMDTSQNTTILTEPDLEQQVRTLPPPRTRRGMTREEARQKARILRLKLGLANYKLQTGQEDVPLEKLQMKPLPGRETTRQRDLLRVMIQPPSSRDGPPGTEGETRDDEAGQSDAEPADQDQAKQQSAGNTMLPRVPEEETRDDDDSTNCGGAVGSLLSLARASSSVATS